MKQNLRFLMLTLLCAVVSTTWGQEVTLNFTDGSWGFPTTKVVTATSYTNSDGYTITVEGTEGNGFRVYSNPDYFLFGQQGASITLPAFDFDVEKIEVVGRSGASGSTKMNVFVGNVAVSTETTGCQGTNTYEIDEDYQAAGNVYKLMVTSKHNAQALAINIYKKEGDQPASDKYYVAGTWTDWQTNKIEMTKKANGTYTLANQELAAQAEFKIIKVASDETETWYGGTGNSAYWVTIDNHTDISLIAGDTPNFHIDVAGTWEFTVDPTGSTPTLTVGGWPEWEYYLKGDFNEWGVVESYKFNDAGSGKYTLNKPIQLGEKFKIYGIRGTEEKWYGAVSNGDFYVEESLVGEELSLTTENGGNNFFMNLTNQKPYWTLDFSPANMTLKLSNYLSNVAELPFEFDGKKSDIQNKAGLTSIGLGSDYNNSPYLKFSSENDALVLHFNERPGTLTYDIKGNPSSGTSIECEFVVQTSENGETYTDLKSYTTLGNTITSEVLNNLGENVRYIKWLYKSKKSGNVALGNITLDQFNAVPVTITDVGYASLYYSSVNLTVPEGVTAYTYKLDADNKPVISKTYGPGSVIPEGEGVILKGDKGTYNFIVTTDVGESDSDNNLYGRDEAGTTVAPGSGSYLFYKLSTNSAGEEVGFYFGAENGAAFTIPAHKAYLAIPGTYTPGGASVFVFDETVGINKVQKDELSAEGIYTLSGIRVNGDNLSKGIYIVNGKKIVIK